MSNKQKQRAPFAFAILLIVVGVLALLAVLGRRSNNAAPPQESRASEERVADMGNAHIDTPEAGHEAYNSIPPTSGPHVGSSIAPWGVHDEQIPDELQIHNLEDGGVIMHYDPVRVDGDTIERMRAFAGKYASEVIMEPYTNPPLPAPIVLTAWTRLMKIEQYDEGRIEAFVAAYRGIDHHKK